MGTETTKAKKAKKPRNPFRGILERLAEDRAAKVELGMMKEEDAAVALVTLDNGTIYGVTLKIAKMRKETK